MNTIIKFVRITTDLVILAVMSLELKEQIEKYHLKKAEKTVAAAQATIEETPNE